ncbi:hypothetical protein NDU88_004766 [Pleurodeles waltl]|uniref:Uncharacterized protein n=1 Tax=Pleurodeles waltl TaxID=8319 RepID=A0AAV7PKR7_PLEWA|nr:hypothetical protein NDU88_004766 [Pleurodeles waltl]
MSPWRAGLISTHQLNSVGPPKSLYQSRSLCITSFGTTPGHSFQPPPGTTGLSVRPGTDLQASPGKISGVGVYNPKVQEPSPRRPPTLAAHQSHSRAPNNEVSAGHRQSRWAPETPFAIQAPPACSARPLSTFRSSEGPRRAPKLSNPRAPAPGDPKGKARLAAQAAPHAALRPRPGCQAKPRSSRRRGRTRLRPAPPHPGHPVKAALHWGILQASPRLVTGRYFGPKRRSAIRNVLALRHLHITFKLTAAEKTPYQVPHTNS